MFFVIYILIPDWEFLFSVNPRNTQFLYKTAEVHHTLKFLNVKITIFTVLQLNTVGYTVFTREML